MFLRGIAINPRNADLYAVLSNVYQRRKRHKEAEDICLRGIKLVPDSARLYSSLGRIYSEEKRYGQAEEMLRKAIEIEPDNDTLRDILGEMCRDENKNEEVKELAQRTLEVVQARPGKEGPGSGSGVAENVYEARFLADGEMEAVGYYGAKTCHNYRMLKRIIRGRGIGLVCVEYPMREVRFLKEMLEPHEGIVFVDNEKSFQEGVSREGYDAYFVDRFGGSFGHCSSKGNTLLAENIADVIAKEYFDR
jgi:tetratricopeptide (TPR) repeat protein